MENENSNTMDSAVVREYDGYDITFLTGHNVMVNATEMAKPFDKQPIDWLKTNAASEFINTYSKLKNFSLADLQQVIRGGNHPGTWFHEDIALEFARWLSPKFAIWCNDRIKELFMYGSTTMSGNEGEESNPAVYNERNLAKVKLYEETICAMGYTYSVMAEAQKFTEAQRMRLFAPLFQELSHYSPPELIISRTENLYRSIKEGRELISKPEPSEDEDLGYNEAVDLISLYRADTTVKGLYSQMSYKDMAEAIYRDGDRLRCTGYKLVGEGLNYGYNVPCFSKDSYKPMIDRRRFGELLDILGIRHRNPTDKEMHF